MQLLRINFSTAGITKNPAIQKCFIHFFIDNSNANISFYTSSCPNFNLGQLKLYKMDCPIELWMILFVFARCDSVNYGDKEIPVSSRCVTPALLSALTPPCLHQ